MRLGDRSDGIDLEWLVRWLDRFELLELRNHRFVNQHRLGVSDAALHDPMTDGQQP